MGVDLIKKNTLNKLTYIKVAVVEASGIHHLILLFCEKILASSSSCQTRHKIVFSSYLHVLKLTSEESLKTVAVVKSS